ncbi:uncharacterized protein AMSG_02231 [Thecamonas trahens ATCC 50062]|uniref:Uncharacterized protein n=1 Tax=Thecamonas trahens ATCC 50062 TaxID=461836 RepID=A0A0L0DVQ5_THETB|nr:hypothetical protein AMSG_02231 [Thecamonas trahens ATCC 50062]KNC56262.1 hypothetical protein AMSG_02231 [Thecamonas trahens ATCC 50062]|eukprot:XP_013760784.1 hypothetical protein AMSG_02231 [Thecamonas trahens ATCC 50062]
MCRPQAVFVLVRLLWLGGIGSTSTLAIFTVTMAVDALLIAQLNKVYDISTGGLSEYFADVLYLSWIALVAASYSMRAFWVFITIPIFALYKLWTSVIAPLLSSSSAPVIEESPAERKIRERKERRKERARMKRH